MGFSVFVFRSATRQPAAISCEGSHHQLLLCEKFMRRSISMVPAAVNPGNRYNWYSIGKMIEKPIHITIVSGIPTRRKSLNL